MRVNKGDTISLNKEAICQPIEKGRAGPSRVIRPGETDTPASDYWSQEGGGIGGGGGGEAA